MYCADRARQRKRVCMKIFARVQHLIYFRISETIPSLFIIFVTTEKTTRLSRFFHVRPTFEKLSTCNLSTVERSLIKTTSSLSDTILKQYNKEKTIGGRTYHFSYHDSGPPISWLSNQARHDAYLSQRYCTNWYCFQTFSNSEWMRFCFIVTSHSMCLRRSRVWSLQFFATFKSNMSV